MTGGVTDEEFAERWDQFEQTRQELHATKRHLQQVYDDRWFYWCNVVAERVLAVVQLTGSAGATHAQIMDCVELPKFITWTPATVLGFMVRVGMLVETKEQRPNIAGRNQLQRVYRLGSITLEEANRRVS